jgi:hypothetical protein
MCMREERLFNMWLGNKRRHGMVGLRYLKCSSRDSGGAGNNILWCVYTADSVYGLRIVTCVVQL